MSKKIKYTQKELKEPDELHKNVARVVDYTADHARRIIYIIVAVIGVLVAAYLVNLNADNKQIEANVAFNSALESYNAGNMEEALKGFSATISEYPGEDISTIAVYYSGIIEYHQGNYEKSISLFDEFLRGDVDEQMLTDAATLTQGLALFNLEKWQESIIYLEHFNQPGNLYEEQAKNHLSIAYQKLGDKDKAEAVRRSLEQTQGAGNPGVPSSVPN